MDLSLISILRNDTDFGKRIIKKVEDLKRDKKNLSDLASQYSDIYKEEIQRGTEQRAKLLTEGKSKGLTEEEILKQAGHFYPTVYTPILNMLYFMLRETETNDPYYGKSFYSKRDKINESIKHEYEEDVKSTVLKEPPKMEEFLYGNLTLEQFDILKKLKALATHSTNINESTLAFKKCKELCREFGLDYDKIPTFKK